MCPFMYSWEEKRLLKNTPLVYSQCNNNTL